MQDGILKDFAGTKIKGHAPELPDGLSPAYLPVIEPVECSLAGMKTRSFIDNGRLCGKHPVICLYDRWGYIVKRWPDDYMPTIYEIRQAVKEGLKQEGRNI